MTYPAVFTYASGSAAVKALLGSSPVRFWPFDLAPGPGKPGYQLPYATHQGVYGTPENTLSCPPSADLYGVQIDAYGTSVSQSRSVAEALREAMEPHGYVVSLGGEEWDQPSGLYRSMFTVEVYVDRT